jgi:murein DD-endopeptidase MepM/ murein hydrolase activator NlpD
MRAIFAAASLLLALRAGLCFAQAPSIQLALPVACELGTTCAVQNYVDHDGKDYRCGTLTYGGHKGTDIRVLDPDAFERGVPVLAAARGRVRAIRDSMRDISIRAPGAPSVAKREAGNSVVIEHGDGWETQYAHLRRGSVKVRAGDSVEPGQVLGTVGLSGQTEFPHLHFEVRRLGRTVDPFVGLERGEPCHAGAAPLWTAPAARVLEYRASGVLDAGISGNEPVLANGHLDRASLKPLLGSSGAAVFWAQLYGVREGDLQELRFIGPDGKVIAQRRAPVTRNLAQSLVYVGARRSFWPAGVYRGEYALIRGTEKVVELTREISVSRQ